MEYKLKKSKTIRLSDTTIKNINYMVKETKISESELLRSIIEKAIFEYRFKKAVELLEKTNSTLSEAAKLSGLSYRDFYEKIIKSKVLSKRDIDKREIEVKEVDDVLRKIKV